MQKTRQYTIPVRLISESNQTGEHWTVKSKRHKTQQLQVKAELVGIKVDLPCTIAMTRLSPRLLDDDNLIGAFKHIRDQIADCIIPGKAKGQADRDPRLIWKYHQEKAKEKGIRIEITTVGDKGASLKS